MASRVGGIQDQLVDERDALLIGPYDLDACAAATSRLLEDLGLAGRLGALVRATAQEHFLGDRHLTQCAELFARLRT